MSCKPVGRIPGHGRWGVIHIDDSEDAALSNLTESLAARLDEDEAAARDASGGTVVGEPGDWKPAPGGDEWEANADVVDGGFGPDGDLEVLVALRPGLPRPPDVMGGYWGAVVSWQADLADRHASAPEPQFRHIARHDPARVLREVAAKRAILAAYQEALRIQDGFKEVSSEEANREALEMVCRNLATVYSDPAWSVPVQDSEPGPDHGSEPDTLGGEHAGP
jgi:hypothetical protein